MDTSDGVFRVDGRVALVTGGAGGIGQTVIDGLARAGAKIAISSQGLGKSQKYAETLQRQGSETFAASFDVLSVTDIQRMVDEVVGHFGRIDILVNLVGLNLEQPAEEVSEEAFDRVIDTNLKGMMFQAQAVARQMIKQETGSKQVHTGSVRSLLGFSSRGYASYCAAKGGMTILCKQLASEWAKYKINVNMVAPTFVRTPQVEYLLSDTTFYNGLISRIPLGRIGKPEDVLSAIQFFCVPGI